nr:hypothetical protein [Nocardiopsis halotolerans]
MAGVRETGDPRGQFLGQIVGVGRSGERVPDPRVRPLRGKGQERQRTVEPVAPVGERGGARLREPAPFPPHEVVERHLCALRSGGVPSLQQSLVGVEQRVRQDPGRAAVEDDVVDDHQDDGLVPGAFEDTHPEKGAPLDLEGQLLLPSERVPHLLVPGQVPVGEVERPLRVDGLVRNTLGAVDHGAEHRMLPHHRPAGLAQDGRVQTADAEAHRNVVGGGSRIGPLERPEATLPLRELLGPLPPPRPFQQVPDRVAADPAGLVVGDEGAELVLQLPTLSQPEER